MNNDQSKVVVIKRYSSLPEAYIDKGLLDNNGIESEVGSESSALPGIDTTTLSVAANDVGRATMIVPDSGANQ